MTTTTVTGESRASGTDSKQLYRVAEAMAVLSLSRSVLYELLRSGRLRSVNEGRTRLVPAAAIAEYVALLEAEAHASQLRAVS
jgi:excisionase family DNA binding protein